MKVKIDYGCPWYMVGVRIFRDLDEAKRYCERMGYPEKTIEYDPEKVGEARLMALQQYAVLEELNRRMNVQYDQTSKELDRIAGMKERYDAIAENGTTRKERFEAEDESKWCGFKMQPLYSKMSGIHIAKEQIYKMEDDLRKIIGGYRMA